MNLKEFIEAEKEDSNMFSRLSGGGHQNLLEEALEVIEGNHLSDAIAQIKSMVDKEGDLTREEFYKILENNELQFTKWDNNNEE